MDSDRSRGQSDARYGLIGPHQIFHLQRRACGLTAASQHRPNSRGQLSKRKWLWNQVGGARVQTTGTFVNALQRSQKHYRQVRLFGANMPQSSDSSGMSDTQLGNLARGAYLHDIGKLGVPDGILLKPGSLTTDERKIMQQHAQIGFDLLKNIPFLADAAEIVLTHHER